MHFNLLIMISCQIPQGQSWETRLGWSHPVHISHSTKSALLQYSFSVIRPTDNKLLKINNIRLMLFNFILSGAAVHSIYFLCLKKIVEFFNHRKILLFSTMG